jgi:hypothetical protein
MPRRWVLLHCSCGGRASQTRGVRKLAPSDGRQTAPAAVARTAGGGGRAGGRGRRHEAVVLEEDLSDEEADSAGPVKWVAPWTCTMLTAAVICPLITNYPQLGASLALGPPAARVANMHCALFLTPPFILHPGPCAPSRPCCCPCPCPTPHAHAPRAPALALALPSSHWGRLGK